MDESGKILSFLKSKYLPKPSKVTTAPTNDDSKEDEVVGEESEFNGDDVENKFLFDKLSNIGEELSKWLKILKEKL